MRMRELAIARAMSLTGELKMAVRYGKQNY